MLLIGPRSRIVALVSAALVLPLRAQFAPAITVPVGTGPEGVGYGDWNGDGNVDLAVAVGSPDRVVFVFNDGVGNFASIVSIATGIGTGPYAVAGADLDADGDADAAVTLSSSNVVRVLLNSNDGEFSLGSVTSTGPQPCNLRAGALFGDAVDLVTVNCNGDSLTLLRNNGDATFSATTLPTGDDPRDLAIADLNADGDADLAASVRGARRLELFANDGVGGLDLALEIPLASQLVPEGVVAANLDLDDDLDLAVAASGSGDELVVRFVNSGPGAGAGTWSGPVACSVGGIGPKGLAALDADLDGDVDLVTADSGSDCVTLLPANGLGSFNAPLTFGVGNAPGFIGVLDMDGNGGPDLAVANVAGDSVSLLRNLGGPNLFVDVGCGLAGTSGIPKLKVNSCMQPAAPFTLELSAAAKYAPGVIVIGLDAVGVPFKGGTLVPSPDLLLPIYTGSPGGVTVKTTLPAGTPPGMALCVQVMVKDSHAMHGVALSNAMQVVPAL